MTPKTRNPAEKSVVWSTTTARISRASRRRGSHVTVGPLRVDSSSRRRPEHLHVVEVREVDQRLDENVLLEVTRCLRDLAHGADRDGGREGTVLLARGVHDLALGHVGVGIDEVDARRVSPSPLPFATPGVLLFSIRTPTPDWGSLTQEHRGPVARDREHAPDEPRARYDRHVDAHAVGLAFADLHRELEVARRALDRPARRSRRRSPRTAGPEASSSPCSPGSWRERPPPAHGRSRGGDAAARSRASTTRRS